MCDVTRVKAVIYHGDGQCVMCIYHRDGKESPMCDVTWVNAVINEGDGQCVMCTYHGDGKESPMCDVTRVHAVIYHGDGEESPMCDVTSIGDQCVMKQGCMQSYVIKMAKSSDDIDHLTSPDHCLNIGDECVM